MFMSFFINICLIIIISFDAVKKVKENSDKNFDIIDKEVIVLSIIDVFLIAIFLYMIIYLIFMGMPYILQTKNYSS